MKSSINPSETIKDIAEKMNRMKANEQKIMFKQDFIKIPEKPKRLELGEIVKINKIEAVVAPNNQTYWIVSLNNGVTTSLSDFNKFLGESLFNSCFIVTEINIRKWFEDRTLKESFRYKFDILKIK